jgi:mxaL protein
MMRGAVLAGRNRLLALAVLLLIIAAALPPLPMPREVYQHLVVFDITQSMNVADQNLNGETLSRLAYAKRLATQSLRSMPCGSKLGLGLFASRRTLLVLAPVEVCANYGELEQAIAQIDGRMSWAQASVISRGLYSAVDVAAELKPSPSLLFITDGHEAPPVPDEEVPEFERERLQVRGSVLGVGSLTPQPIPRSDNAGRFIGWWGADEVVQRPRVQGEPESEEQLSALHEKHLLALGRVAALQYVRATTAQAFTEAWLSPRLAHREIVPTDLRWVPALLAGIALAAFFVPARQTRRARVGLRASSMRDIDIAA